MSDDLITSGTFLDQALSPVQRETLVAGKITEYLERHDKTLNEDVLAWMMEAFRRKVVKQIMSVRDTRKDHDSCSMYAGPCARKAWHQRTGTVGERVQARQIMKFLMGDTVELDVVGIARLAGVELVDNNRTLFVTGLDGIKAQVHPDGRVCKDGKDYNFECKSADTFTFDSWLANGGPDDKWGYLTQASVEAQAWRESGYDVDSTVFVAVSTGSRQGTVAEWILPYDQSLVDAWHERRILARGTDIPPIPFQAEAETEYKPGKLLEAEFIADGAKPRVNAKGTIYGWDIATGRTILPMVCSYCAYKGQCWPGAEMDVKGNKPVWVCK